MASQIQTRRDTLNNWTITNPTLAQGEVGWVIGTNDFKIGDGITAWNSLPYIQFGEIPNNGTLTIQKNGTTIATFTANQAGDTTANIVADTPAWGNITGDMSAQTDLSQALSSKLTSADILNVLNSTAIDKALSANMGKELNDRLNNVESRGRFLSVWVCTTGLPETNPVGLEIGDTYVYQRGDYYIVGTVGTTNYKPTGSSYVVGTASTIIETEIVKENDTYIYDGAHWILQQNVDREVTFSSIAGSPYDNSNLSGALGSKQDEITQNNMLSADLVDDTSTTNKFVTATDITNWNGKVTANTAITGGTKCKITYDAKGLVTGGDDLSSSDVTTALGYTPQAPATIETLDATDSITLADNTIYNGGTQTALTIALWGSPTASSIAEIVFTSGATATTLTYSNTIKWLDGSDDVASNVFTPVANKRYTVMFYYDGTNTIAVVKGV